MTDGFDPPVTEASDRSTGCTENVPLQEPKLIVIISGKFVAERLSPIARAEARY